MKLIRGGFVRILGSEIDKLQSLQSMLTLMEAAFRSAPFRSDGGERDTAIAESMKSISSTCNQAAAALASLHDLLQAYAEATRRKGDEQATETAASEPAAQERPPLAKPAIAASAKADLPPAPSPSPREPAGAEEQQPAAVSPPLKGAGSLAAEDVFTPPASLAVGDPEVTGGGGPSPFDAAVSLLDS